MPGMFGVAEEKDVSVSQRQYDEGRVELPSLRLVRVAESWRMATSRDRQGVHQTDVYDGEDRLRNC